MKKINILFTAIILLVYACNDDFLERTPGSNISDEDYWKSVNDLQLYSNNFYNVFLNTYTGYGTIGIYGIDGDDGTDTQISSSYNTTMNGERLVPQSGGGWSAANWASLRDVNYFMDNYKRVNASFDDVKQYLGEALFFRSWFYFDKLRTFGDVPFISTTLETTSAELYDARLPRNQVVDSVMRDLDLAVEYLPSFSGWTGRITKEVAMLMQARIALYEGTWEKYHAGTDFGVKGSDGSKYIEKAAEVSRKLINAKTCDLDNKGVADGYRDLFKREDHSTSKEVLLWRKYSVNDGIYHVWGRYTGGGAGRGVTKEMIDSYLDINGKPIAASTVYVEGDETLAEIAANRDPRLAQTIFTSENDLLWTNNADGKDIYFKYPGISADNEVRCVTGYHLYKGHNPDNKQYQASQCITALIYFRYAEALLIYAEAKAELGTITQEDVDITINELRKRVGMDNGLLNIGAITPDPDWEFPALSPIINEVRRERKVELNCEGFRKDDIFRWAAADELVVGKRPKGAKKSQWDNIPDIPEYQDIRSALKSSNYNTDADGYIDPFQITMPNGYGFKVDRDYLSPIPLSEMVINPNLKQNPGWE